MSITRNKGCWLVLIAALPLLGACEQAVEGELSSSEGAAAESTVRFEVHKSPACECCDAWMAHLQGAGFTPECRHPARLAEVKAHFGIQPEYRSCHTAVSESGHVFEGHVPARYIHRFLADPPEGAVGLAVPGMPVGSPGMEVGGRFQPYHVLVLRADGTTDVYTRLSSMDQQYQAERSQ